MLRSFSFILVGVLLFSCKGKQNQLFYANGKPVTDPVSVNAINRALSDISKAEKAEFRNVKIYTSLQPGVDQNLESVADVLGDSLYKLAVWDDVKAKRFTDSLRSAGRNCLDYSVVVIDNETGQIIVNSSSWSGADADGVSAKNSVGGLGKVFLFALAMQEEYTPDSIYPQLRYAQGFGAIDENSHRTFYNALARNYGSFPYGLGDRYSGKKTKSFISQLHIDAEDVSINPVAISMNASLLDISKAYAAFFNKGVQIEPTIIDSIIDCAGKVVYRRKQIAKRVLNETTAYEMVRLLDYYSHEGIGQSVFTHNRHAPDYIGSFAGTSLRTASGYFIAVQKNYTTGIFTRFVRGDVRIKIKRPNSAQSLTVPLWLKLNECLEQKYGNADTTTFSVVPKSYAERAVPKTDTESKIQI